KAFFVGSFQEAGGDDLIGIHILHFQGDDSIFKLNKLLHFLRELNYSLPVFLPLQLRQRLGDWPEWSWLPGPAGLRSSCCWSRRSTPRQGSYRHSSPDRRSIQAAGV